MLHWLQLINELESPESHHYLFDRQLEKGYTLIRNMPLRSQWVVVPIIYGTQESMLIYVTYLRRMKQEPIHGMRNRGMVTNPRRLI
jgi:hypothetical protein